MPTERIRPLEVGTVLPTQIVLMAAIRHTHLAPVDTHATLFTMCERTCRLDGPTGNTDIPVTVPDAGGAVEWAMATSAVIPTLMSDVTVQACVTSVEPATVAIAAVHTTLTAVIHV